ncbi:hypothetical protein [Nocardia sp. NPDC057455]|uniref:hypothetical protein n=1 Tax=Nocardia sp. NPDC057455 TaxID=3346138 RepID=UPI00366C633A
MAFATADQIAEQWRPLTPRERARAARLLDLAEQLIRGRVIIDESDTAKLAVARQLSIELVADALESGPRVVGPRVTQAALDTGSYTVELPDGAGRAWLLTWSDDMYALFGLSNGQHQPAYYFGDCPQ